MISFILLFFKARVDVIIYTSSLDNPSYVILTFSFYLFSYNYIIAFNSSYWNFNFSLCSPNTASNALAIGYVIGDVMAIKTLK